MDMNRHRMLLSQIKTNPPVPENTKLLLHFNDNLTDAMGNFTVSRDSGTPSYTNGMAGFGKAVEMVSPRFFGLSHSDHLNLTGDFTIATWVYKPLGNNGTLISSQRWSGEDYVNGYFFNVLGTGGLRLSVQTGVDSTSISSSSGVVPGNTWCHVACTRSSGTVRLFAGGTLVGSGTNSSTLRCESNYRRSIGSFQTNYEGQIGGTFSGYLDEFLLVKGSALWTADFTPPTVSYA